MSQSLSFAQLIDQYQAIQQKLLVKLQNSSYNDVAPFWRDSQASFYNKRNGLRPMTISDIEGLLTGYGMMDELGVLRLLTQCRDHLSQIFKPITAGKLKSLPLEPDTITRLRLLQRKKESWEIDDIQLVLDALGGLSDQIRQLLDLPNQFLADGPNQSHKA